MAGSDPTASGRAHGSRRRVAAVLLALSMVGAACGGSRTDAEILAASGVRSTATTLNAGADPAASSDQSVAIGEQPNPGGETTDPGGPVAPTTMVAGAAPGATVGTPGERGPIIIGSVGTYSGPVGSSTAGIPQAVQVWAAKINAAGGLFGRQIQVIVQDDGGDPARYGAAVRDLVENRKVVAFVANGASSTAQGGAAYLRQVGVPVIGTDCSNDLYLTDPMIFSQCARIADLTLPGLRAATKLQDGRRLGFVYCSESTQCTSAEPLIAKAAAQTGIQVVYKAAISIAQIDFTGNCQAAKGANVELMVVLGDANTLARFAKSCDRQAFRPLYVQPSISVAPTTLSVPGLENLLLQMQTGPFADVSGPAFDEFKAAFARQDIKPGPASSLGWAAAKLFELVATRAAAKTQSLNPKSIVDALHTVDGENLGGLTTNLDLTNGFNNAPCIFVMQGDGKGGWKSPFGAEPQCP